MSEAVTSGVECGEAQWELRLWSAVTCSGNGRGVLRRLELKPRARRMGGGGGRGTRPRGARRGDQAPGLSGRGTQRVAQQSKGVQGMTRM
jgi:hypothetical protein